MNRSGILYYNWKRRCWVKLWKCFNILFNCLPIAWIIDSSIFCVSGGISPELLDVKDINNIKRPTEASNSGLLCDCIWAQFDWDSLGWSIDIYNSLSYIFGIDIVQKFLVEQQLNTLISSNLVWDGWEEYMGSSFIRIFSSPNFWGEYDNWGWVLKIHGDLSISKTYFYS